MSEVLRFNFVYEEKSSSLQLAAERNSGRLLIRCIGFFGAEDTIPDYRWDYTMDEGDWDKLMMILEDHNAAKWEAAYLDRNVENGATWSLEIHTLGRHTLTEGYARFPKEFESFKEDVFAFLRMKRKQLSPTEEDLRYIGVAEQKGLLSPIVFADRMEQTFTFYNLFDDIEHDGTYFMKEGDWDSLQAIVVKHDVFSKFSGLPPRNELRSQDQFSVSIAYKPGTITQRFCGTEPSWWGAFSEEFLEKIKSMHREGRKSADGNFGAMN